MASGKAIERDGIRIFMGKGNIKLSGDILIFNLPAVKTCPNCKSCAKTCYARKAERLYPQVLPCREMNLEATKSDQFVSLTVSLIKSCKGIKYVRIHESGDFYSQEYADKWAAIAAQCPDIQFYCYTKSPYRPTAKNINVVNSILPNGLINFGPKQYVEDMHGTYGFPICPAVNPDGKLNHGVSCGKNCSLCMNTPNVLFYTH